MSTRSRDKDGIFWNHDKDSKKDYTVDWTEWLAESSDSIVSTYWSVTPSGMNIESYDVSAGKATVWVSGGDNGTTYTLSSKIFTATRRDERSFRLKVKDL